MYGYNLNPLTMEQFNTTRDLILRDTDIPHEQKQRMLEKLSENYGDMLRKRRKGEY